jgi:hypothetical protein
MAGVVWFSKIVHIIKICKYFDKVVLCNPPHAYSANRYVACQSLRETNFVDNKFKVIGGLSFKNYI